MNDMPSERHAVNPGDRVRLHFDLGRFGLEMDRRDLEIMTEPIRTLEWTKWSGR